jgi:hypothetical protein
VTPAPAPALLLDAISLDACFLPFDVTSVELLLLLLFDDALLDGVDDDAELLDDPVVTALLALLRRLLPNPCASTL